MLSSHWVNGARHQVSAQFKGGITAKGLKIWALVKKRVPRTTSHAPMGHYPLLKKHNLESWEKPASALGRGAAAEQGKKQAGSRVRYLL